MEQGIKWRKLDKTQSSSRSPRRVGLEFLDRPALLHSIGAPHCHPQDVLPNIQFCSWCFPCSEIFSRFGPVFCIAVLLHVIGRNQITSLLLLHGIRHLQVSAQERCQHVRWSMYSDDTKPSIMSPIRKLWGIWRDFAVSTKYINIFLGHRLCNSYQNLHEATKAELEFLARGRCQTIPQQARE